MKVLLLTNKSDVTTDFIVLRLRELEIPFYRFNTEDIGRGIFVTIDFESREFLIFDSILDQKFHSSEFSAVYYRRPEIPITDVNLTVAESLFIKSEITYTLEGIYRILENLIWLNNVVNIRNAENKVYQLLLAKSIGFEVPASIISNSYEEIEHFFVNNNENCIIKPIKSGLVHSGEQEEAVIFTSKVLRENFNYQNVIGCPVYFQRLIIKAGDVRVTVVGDIFFSAFIHSQESESTSIDWRKGEKPLRYSPIELPDYLKKKCRKLMQELNLNFGAIDFVLDENGNFIFLEINPNGQWAWIEKRLNYPICATIVKYLTGQ